MFGKKIAETVEKSSQGQTQSIADSMRDRALNYLKQEGYRAEVDGDGDIRCKREGHVYYLEFGSVSKNFFYMKVFSLVDFCEDEEVSLEDALLAANTINREYRLGKASVNLNNRYVTINVVNVFENTGNPIPVIEAFFEIVSDFIKDFTDGVSGE